MLHIFELISAPPCNSYKCTGDILLGLLHILHILCLFLHSCIAYVILIQWHICPYAYWNIYCIYLHLNAYLCRFKNAYLCIFGFAYLCIFGFAYLCISHCHCHLHIYAYSFFFIHVHIIFLHIEAYWGILCAYIAGLTCIPVHISCIFGTALQSWAWALKKSLHVTRPSSFLYFQEIRNKWSQWPGSQSAPRLYNRCNLCQCSYARPAQCGAWALETLLRFAQHQ